MLNQEQKNQFITACDEFGYGITESNIAEIKDTIDDFKSSWGNSQEEETETGTLHTWEGIQTKKGKQRGDLMVMDFSDIRASYFSGEA